MFDFVEETARLDAMEKFPDSARFSEIRFSSETVSGFEDTVNYTFYGVSNGNKVDLFSIEILKEDIGDADDFKRKLDKGVNKANENKHVLRQLSNIYLEGERSKYIYDEIVKAGVIDKDATGKKLGKHEGLWEIVTNSKDDLTEASKDKLMATLFYPTKQIVIADCISYPMPENMPKDEYEHHVRREMLNVFKPKEPEEEKKEKTVVKSDFDNTLERYYHYIHSQDRAERQKCIAALRDCLKDNLAKFISGKNYVKNSVKEAVKETVNKGTEKIKESVKGTDTKTFHMTKKNRKLLKGKEIPSRKGKDIRSNIKKFDGLDGGIIL